MLQSHDGCLVSRQFTIATRHVCVARRGTVHVLAHGESLRLFLIPPLFASRIQLPRMATSAIRATNARMDAFKPNPPAPRDCQERIIAKLPKGASGRGSGERALAVGDQMRRTSDVRTGDQSPAGGPCVGPAGRRSRIASIAADETMAACDPGSRSVSTREAVNEGRGGANTVQQSRPRRRPT